MTGRAAGVLLHITSLPGPYGAGTLGREAHAFLDFLARAGQRWWQLLPLTPAGGGDSPYQSPSAFAGNPLLIDPGLLLEEDLLTEKECAAARREAPDRADLDWAKATRGTLLEAAFRRGKEREAAAQARFATENAAWLGDFALFTALRERFGPPQGWPGALRRRDGETVRRWSEELAERIAFHAWVQFVFQRQWDALRRHARERGVRILGDVPIYVSADSAEVWSRPTLFQVDADLNMTAEAGVPPDGFSPPGQRWGCPLYAWDAHTQEDCAWWLSRLRRAASLYDAARLDHFRGFEACWEIPVGLPAAEGRWRKGPGMDFLRAVRRALPDVPLVAEDLGTLTPSALEFIAASGLPGMRVLVSAFGAGGASSFLPHRIPENAVVYTSTHDTPTFVEWLFSRASDEERRFAVDYLRLRENEGFGWGAVCGAWQTSARLAIAPMQDILGLGADARMNAPGTVGGDNWRWRVRPEALNAGVAERLRRITEVYGR